MSFETDVASSILGRVGNVEVPELYAANAQFGGALQSVFVPGSYGGQSRQYDGKESIGVLSAPSKYNGHPLGYQPVRRFDEKNRGHDSLAERLGLMSPQANYKLQ